MFTDNEQNNHLYRGYNPAFVKQVMARRKAEADAKEAEMKAAALAESRARREAQRLELKRIIAQARAERQAEEELAKRTKVTDIMFPQDIIRHVAAIHGLNERDLVGRSQANDVVAARNEAIVTIKEMHGWSSVKIGKLFHRDHTTILSVLWKARKHLDRET